MDIRSARRSDQPLISATVRSAGLIPFGVAWPRFVVAEIQGQIIGLGQLKVHCDGSYEIASLVVLEEYRHSGIGSLLMQTLMRLADRPLYLICPEHLEPYYARFGFRRASPRRLTPYFWAVAVIARIVGWIRRLRGSRRNVRILCCSNHSSYHEI